MGGKANHLFSTDPMSADLEPNSFDDSIAHDSCITISVSQRFCYSAIWIVAHPPRAWRCHKSCMASEQSYRELLMQTTNDRPAILYI